MIERLRRRAKALKAETYALYFACRDPRTPWYAKAVAAAVVAYALSPVDLIPDFVPVLGYLDDLILVPIGIALAIKLVPSEVMTQCRDRAHVASARPMSRIGAAFIVAAWLAVGVWLVLLVRGLLDT